MSRPAPSDALQLVRRQSVVDIASVESASGFEEHYVNFLGGHGTVLSAARHDHEFAFAQLHGFDGACRVFVIHAKVTVEYQEQLVFSFMPMPDELALKLNQFHMLAVELADDLGRPVILEGSELLRHVYLVHDPK